MKLINTALDFSVPSSEWMKDGAQNYLELWPFQEHFFWLNVRGYASENSCHMSRTWNLFLRGLPASPSSILVSTNFPLKPASGRLFSPRSTWESAEARPVIMMANGEKSPCISEESINGRVSEIYSALHQWCQVKAFGPRCSLACKYRSACKKREQTFFLELIMYISSNSNHPWKTLWYQSLPSGVGQTHFILGWG